MTEEQEKRPMYDLDRRAIAALQGWVQYLEKWCSEDTGKIRTAKQAVEDAIVSFEEFWDVPFHEDL
jgi:hypothetical protein